MKIAKKYRLPPDEEKRHKKLLFMHCLNRLNKSETAEFEWLDRKRHRLLYRHPKMQESLRAGRNSMRRLHRVRERLRAAALKAGFKLDPV